MSLCGSQSDTQWPGEIIAPITTEVKELNSHWARTRTNTNRLFMAILLFFMASGLVLAAISILYGRMRLYPDIVAGPPGITILGSVLVLVLALVWMKPSPTSVRMSTDALGLEYPGGTSRVLEWNSPKFDLWLEDRIGWRDPDSPSEEKHYYLMETGIGQSIAVEASFFRSLLETAKKAGLCIDQTERRIQGTIRVRYHLRQARR